MLRAIGAVGSALERHSRGHKFEPCIAHHLKRRLVKVFFYRDKKSNVQIICYIKTCANIVL